jgi:hypothetical protein
MKRQGLRIEDSQLHTAERLVKLVAIAAKAAVTTIQLVQAREGKDPQPATLVFDDTAIEVLGAVAQKQYAPRTKRQRNPHPHASLAWAAWIIARLGGWDGYPKSRPPGPITMLSGLKSFHAILVGWNVRNV